MNLKTRSTLPELMDREGDDDEIRDALRELKIINKVLGGNTVSASAVRYVKKKYNLNTVTILDAGSGASDILTAERNNENYLITSLDKNKLICRILKEQGNVWEVTCGVAEKLPFKPHTFDIVHASLFLHHFNEDNIQGLINEFTEAAKYAVIINDIHRTYISYYGFKILSLLFSDNRLVRYDGPLSVLRGFKKSELKSVLEQTGLKYKLSWRWAFRWQIIIYSDEQV